MIHSIAYCIFCLNGLRRMYFPERHLFSATYRLADDTMENFEEPSLQLKYTLNTLMGLNKACKAGYAVFADPERDFAHVLVEGKHLLGNAENLAAAAWAADAIGVDVPAGIVDDMRKCIRQANRHVMTAQALAWMILASVGSGSPLHAGLPELLEFAVSRYVHPRTYLVRHLPTGYRRSVASFAASCYMAYALLVVARRSANPGAHEMGLRIARGLVSLQGSEGQWAWFYHVPRGEVLDYYPVYSVHQHAMAPFFLLEAIDLGHDEFRQPLRRGFKWILRPNEAGDTMLSPERHVIWRSVERRRPFGRAIRGLLPILVRKGQAMTEGRGSRLRLVAECRSYELGWGLWAFAGREDFDDILNDPAFAVGRGMEGV